MFHARPLKSPCRCRAAGIALLALFACSAPPSVEARPRSLSVARRHLRVRRHKPKPKPHPKAPRFSSLCADQAPGATRWLGGKPHTPLAIADARGLRTAGFGCCASFARAGAGWRAVDAWGGVLENNESAGAALPDATHCGDVRFNEKTPVGVALYASLGGLFASPPSAEWKPTDTEIRHFMALAAQLQMMVTPDAEAEKHGSEKVEPVTALFFQVPTGDDLQGPPAHLAVAGGRILVLAEQRTDGRWLLVRLDTDVTNRVVLEDGYTPIAVFDMDGDGVPEIVYHANFGDSYSDIILRRETRGRRWQKQAESIPGGAH